MDFQCCYQVSNLESFVQLFDSFVLISPLCYFIYEKHMNGFWWCFWITNFQSMGMWCFISILFVHHMFVCRFLKEEWNYLNENVSSEECPFQGVVWKNLSRKVEKKRIEVLPYPLWNALSSWKTGSEVLWKALLHVYSGLAVKLYIW